MLLLDNVLDFGARFNQLPDQHRILHFRIVHLNKKPVLIVLDIVNERQAATGDVRSARGRACGV